MNWIGFAVSQHLNLNPAKAIDILEAYEGTLEDDPPDSEGSEHGEMPLYKISLMEECGFLERALEELHKKEPKIVDKLTVKEQEASLLVKLGRLEDGEKLYTLLLSMNPDNYRYYEGLQRCVGIQSNSECYSPDEVDQLDALYKSLQQQHTRSSAVNRKPLDFLNGEKFRVAADNYMRPLLTKGVPSLFSDLSPLYDHPGKADTLEQFILDFEHSIKNTGEYPGRSMFVHHMCVRAGKVSIVRTEKESPSTLLWILFYLAQHYDRRGQYDVAITKINEAIEHTPTVIDLYSVKKFSHQRCQVQLLFCLGVIWIYGQCQLQLFYCLYKYRPL